MVTGLTSGGWLHLNESSGCVSASLVRVLSREGGEAKVLSKAA